MTGQGVLVGTPRVSSTSLQSLKNFYLDSGSVLLALQAAQVLSGEQIGIRSWAKTTSPAEFTNLQFFYYLPGLTLAISQAGQWNVVALA